MMRTLKMQRVPSTLVVVPTLLQAPPKGRAVVRFTGLLCERCTALAQEREAIRSVAIPHVVDMRTKEVHSHETRLVRSFERGEEVPRHTCMESVDRMFQGNRDRRDSMVVKMDGNPVDMGTHTASLVQKWVYWGDIDHDANINCAGKDGCLFF